MPFLNFNFLFNCDFCPVEERISFVFYLPCNLNQLYVLNKSFN